MYGFNIPKRTTVGNVASNTSSSYVEKIKDKIKLQYKRVRKKNPRLPVSFLFFYLNKKCVARSEMCKKKKKKKD